MIHETTQDEVRVLFAYADPERRRQSGPSLAVFGEDGAVSAGILIDHPCAEGRDGTHGPPAKHVERVCYRVTLTPHPDRATFGDRAYRN